MKRLRIGLIASWAVFGVAALVGRALWRLTPVAWEAVRAELQPFQWIVLIGWVATSAYSEGYVGFHQKFSPRVTKRAIELGRKPSSFVRVILAAPYAMGLFAAEKRTIIAGWLLLIGIVVLVIIVRRLDQPWRGIIDAGVVVGLGLGLLSLLFHFVKDLAQSLKS